MPSFSVLSHPVGRSGRPWAPCSGPRGTRALNKSGVSKHRRAPVPQGLLEMRGCRGFEGIGTRRRGPWRAAGGTVERKPAERSTNRQRRARTLGVVGQVSQRFGFQGSRVAGTTTAFTRPYVSSLRLAWEPNTARISAQELLFAERSRSSGIGPSPRRVPVVPTSASPKASDCREGDLSPQETIRSVWPRGTARSQDIRHFISLVSLTPYGDVPLPRSC